MPARLQSSANDRGSMMSRRTRSLRSVCQFQPTALRTWPFSYAAVSTSTSTRRTLGSLMCSATQPVVTNTSGCAYVVLMDLSSTHQPVALASRLDDVLPLEPLRRLVHHPTRHVRRLAVQDRDDDVAVERPAVLSVVVARARGGVRVTVVKAQHDPAFRGRRLLCLHQRVGRDEEAVEALLLLELVLDLLDALDDAAELIALARLDPEQDAAAFVRVGVGAFALDLPGHRLGKQQF